MMEKRHLNAGDILIKSGDKDKDVFLVEQGRVAVMATRPDGSKFRVRSMRPGAFVGEIASYAGLHRTADVIVEEPTIV